ncbi:MAG: AraC family transcriptional regulator [Clostridia bacterium]|nr:AraC family transcriptional regulator [Clostridia bacterium]
MISKDNAVLQIIGVEHLTWKEEVCEVAPRNFSVLAFRIRGSASIQSGEKTYKIKENDILYLPQGMSYKAHYTATDLFAIHFKTFLQDTEIQIRTPGDPAYFQQLFSKARELWKKREPGYETFAMAELYGVLGALEAETAKSNLPKHFLKAVAFTNTHFTEQQLTVEQICKEAGIAGTSFRQLFKKHYGQAPTKYITKLRLEYARKLLSGGATVEHAAEKSGFSDPKYFARVVKKNFGCTPKGLKGYGK